MNFVRSQLNPFFEKTIAKVTDPANGHESIDSALKELTAFHAKILDLATPVLLKTMGQVDTQENVAAVVERIRSKSVSRFQEISQEAVRLTNTDASSLQSRRANASVVPRFSAMGIPEEDASIMTRIFENTDNKIALVQPDLNDLISTWFDASGTAVLVFSNNPNSLVFSASYTSFFVASIAGVTLEIQETFR